MRGWSISRKTKQYHRKGKARRLIGIAGQNIRQRNLGHHHHQQNDNTIILTVDCNKGHQTTPSPPMVVHHIWKPHDHKPDEWNPGEVPPLPRNLTLVLKSDSRVRWMLKSSGIQVHGHRGDDVDGKDHYEYGCSLLKSPAFGWSSCWWWVYIGADDFNIM